MSGNRKIYRIESFALEKARRSQTTSGSGEDEDAAARHAEIMAELAGLRSSMRPQKQEISISMVDEFKAELVEAQKLKLELDEIRAAINDTKIQIASVHNSSFDPEQMGRVANELDAIVDGTESATETILAAAELVDERAGELSASLSGSQKEAADDITDKIVTIFEACNFQDLTGQRITKIVNTLKFVEDRIDRMMEIWGGIESFKDVEVVAPPTRSGDAALLNGPALEDDVNLASQDDIDALFD